MSLVVSTNAPFFLTCASSPLSTNTTTANLHWHKVRRDSTTQQKSRFLTVLLFMYLTNLSLSVALFLSDRRRLCCISCPAFRPRIFPSEFDSTSHDFSSWLAYTQRSNLSSFARENSFILFFRRPVYRISVVFRRRGLFQAADCNIFLAMLLLC